MWIKNGRADVRGKQLDSPELHWKPQAVGDVSVMPVLLLSYLYFRSIELGPLWNNPLKTHKTLQSSTLLYSVINLVYL